jgi:hypothetical protein
MKHEAKWKRQFDEEITRAEEARRDQNEGRARVCARRAAGIVIGEYLARSGIPNPGVSVLDRLKKLDKVPGMSQEIKQVIYHLSQRVNQQHTLPIEADLIAEVRWLEQELLSNSIISNSEKGDEY